jgi:hypothetical protein
MQTFHPCGVFGDAGGTIGAGVKMEIKKGTPILISATKEWNQAAFRFLSGKMPNLEADHFFVSGTFESFGSEGLWFKFTREDEKKSSVTLLIQWHEIRTVVLSDDLETQESFKQYGY